VKKVSDWFSEMTTEGEHITLTSASLKSNATPPFKYMTVEIDKVVSGDVDVDEKDVPREYSNPSLNIAIYLGRQTVAFN
jgi:hypothetical protein